MTWRSDFLLSVLVSSVFFFWARKSGQCCALRVEKCFSGGRRLRENESGIQWSFFVNEQRQFFGKMTPAEVLAFLARQRQAATAAQQGDRATAYAAFESLYDRRHVRGCALSRRKTCRSERSAGHA